MPIEVIGSVFAGRGREGDFAWMIERPEYADALFVFNDNEEQFRAHIADPEASAGCDAGGGNAAIRPWQCTSPPRAAGIPTGTLAGGGYPALTDGVKRTLDEAIARIRNLVKTLGYRRIYYSAADADGTLGTGIFAVDEAVKAYITDELRSLAEDG